MESLKTNIDPSGLLDLDQIAARMNLTVSQVKHLRRSRRLAFLVGLGKLYSRQDWIDEFYEREKDI